MGIRFLRQNRREFLRRPEGAVRATIGLARRGNHILVAAPPKSGSTLLTRLLCALSSDHQQASFLPTTGDREQLIDESYIYRGLPLGQWGVSQQHVRASAHLLEVCARHKIRPIVLQRDVLDMLVSMRDHLDQSANYPLPHFSLKSQHWSAMAASTKFEFLIVYMLPWYVDFSAGWLTAIRDGQDVPVISYSDLTEGSPQLVSALGRLGIQGSGSDVAAALGSLDPKKTNMNVGVPGRGMQLLELVPSAREEVRRLIALHPVDLRDDLHAYLLGNDVGNCAR